MSDLDFLANVKPVQTAFRKSSRGRQPGKNVMESHVIASYDSPKPLAVEVPAGSAHTVERAIRRAGTAHKWTVSVQGLRVHPDKATDADVIPLREFPDLTNENDGDVWISFKAVDKDDDDKPADKATETKSATTAAPADPFKGTGEAMENGAANVAKTPAVRKSVAAK